MSTREDEVLFGFRRFYDRDADLVVSAPGRVNLIGEHTDYNGGYVFPLALPQRTYVAGALRRDRLVRLMSSNRHKFPPRRFVLGEEVRRKEWSDYVEGTTTALAQRGLAIGGCDLFVMSDLPVGSGLSSSAALTVSVLRAFRALFELSMDDMMLAELAYIAEHSFVGVPIGVMDPLAVSLAGQREALFLDTRTLAHELVPLPESADIVVIDAGVPHDLRSGGYEMRRRECARAAHELGVTFLRDLDGDAISRAESLPDPLNRRVRHVVSENARVLDVVHAFREGDREAVGRAFRASHASMRDDFEVSVPAIDRLVDILDKESRCFGARLTGGGFGGAVVAFVDRGSAESVAERASAAYRALKLGRPTIVFPWSGPSTPSNSVERRHLP